VGRSGDFAAGISTRRRLTPPTKIQALAAKLAQAGETHRVQAAQAGLRLDRAEDLQRVAAEAWDELHGVKRSAAQLATRHAFAYAQLGLAARELAQGELVSVLHRVDRVLIIAGDDEDHVATSAADHVHAVLVAQTPMKDIPRTWPNVNSAAPSTAPLPVGHYVYDAAQPQELFDFSQPFVVDDLVRSWPALRKWTPTYFARVLGLRTVPVEVGADCNAPDWRLELVTFNEFLLRFVMRDCPDGDRGYLAQHSLLSQVPALAVDVLPTPALVESSEPHINVWIGPARTLTPMHHDPYKNLFVQVVGEKRVSLQRAAGWDQMPQLVLGPGEALYIPAGWGHEMHALSTSLVPPWSPLPRARVQTKLINPHCVHTRTTESVLAFGGNVHDASTSSRIQERP
jgi:hypothetical protein